MVNSKNFKIGGFQKLSLLDYPGKMCAIIFTDGCNLRCPYCHNYELVENEKENDLIEPKEIINYLIKRKNVLDGLTISGGEPTMQIGLEEFIKEVKEKTGLSIKLDTNGINTQKLKKLVDKKLVDYVAMDIKCDLDGYKKVSGIPNIDLEKIKESIKILKENTVDYEFRTTIIKNYHSVDKIKNILKMIGYDAHYYLQKFIVSDNVPDKSLLSFDDVELKKIYNEIKKDYPNVKIRGI